MMQTLWELEVPSTSFLRGVRQETRPGRTLVLTFSYEGADEVPATTEMHFHAVAAFKCSFLPALASEAIESSYDRLVDMGETPWLLEVVATATRRKMPANLKHLRITFDDGPSFDVICKEHSMVSIPS
jgi:hypothetical protein